MPTLVESLVQAIAAEPDKPFAIQVQGETEASLTFADLLRRAWVFRDRFAAMGVQPGEVVLIILRHCADQYPCFLGAMLLGAIPSFMPFRTPRQDPDRYWSAHRELFHRIGAGVLATYAENRDAICSFLPDLPFALLEVEELRDYALPTLEQALDRSRALHPEPEAVAFLQHSSGTTGHKKGVMLSHRAVMEQVAAYGHALGLKPGHRLVSWLPLYHDMGLIACFMMPMVLGNTVVTLDPFEWVIRPGILLDAIQRHRCHFAWLPNFAFHHLARCAPEGQCWDLSSIRALINCSEPCQPAAFAAFLERFESMGIRRESLQVCYAMAETVFAVTQTTPGQAVGTLTAARGPLAGEGRIVSSEGGLGLLSCGRPLVGARVEIRDRDGQNLPSDRVGEVNVSAPFLFDGYFRLPEPTAARLDHGVLRTGDLGFLHGGELFITGRLDDQIAIYGQNHYAHDIEACVDGLPGLIPGRRVAVGRPNGTTGSHEALVIAETNGTDPTGLRRAVKQRVMDALGQALAEVALVPPGWLVKTTSGKLSREANLRKLMEGETSHA